MSWCQLLCLTIRSNKHEVGLAQASVQYQRQHFEDIGVLFTYKFLRGLGTRPDV